MHLRRRVQRHVARHVKWQPQLTSTSGYTTGPLPDLVCYVDNPEHHLRVGRHLNLSVVQTPTSLHEPAAGPARNYEGGMVSSYQLFTQQLRLLRGPGRDAARRRSWACRRPCGSTRRTRRSTARSPTAGRSTTASSTPSYPTTDIPVVHYPGFTRTIPTRRTTAAPSRAPAPPGSSTPTPSRGRRPPSRPTSTVCPASPTRTRRTCRAPTPRPALQPAVLHGLYVGARVMAPTHRGPGHVPGAPRHDEDRLDPGLAVRLTVCSGHSLVGTVEFSNELHDDIAAGDITVSFRLWRRPPGQGRRALSGRPGRDRGRQHGAGALCLHHRRPTSVAPASPTARRCASGPPMPVRSHDDTLSTASPSTW